MTLPSKISSGMYTPPGLSIPAFHHHLDLFAASGVGYVFVGVGHPRRSSITDSCYELFPLPLRFRSTKVYTLQHIQSIMYLSSPGLIEHISPFETENPLLGNRYNPCQPK